MIQPENTPKLPIIEALFRNPRESDKVIGSVNGDTAINNNIANIILSLRTISEQNWSDHFKSISCLEQTLS